MSFLENTTKDIHNSISKQLFILHLHEPISRLSRQENLDFGIFHKENKQE